MLIKQCQRHPMGYGHGIWDMAMGYGTPSSDAWEEGQATIPLGLSDNQTRLGLRQLIMRSVSKFLTLVTEVSLDSKCLGEDS